MPKQRLTTKEQLISLCSDINKKYGEGTIYTVGSESANRVKRWSTNIQDLDNILGGGMPYGRIVELFGAEGTAKTSLLYHLYSLHEIALHIPAEATYNEERAKVFGNVPKQLFVFRPKYGEAMLNKAIQLAKKGMPIIGIDSVPSVIPKDDFEKVEKAVRSDTVEQKRMGGTARLLNDYLPELNATIEQTGSTIIFVNQLRDKMQTFGYGDTTHTPGGRALKHYKSVSIKMTRKGYIKIPNKNPYNSANEINVGMILRCKIEKSNISNPGGECEIPLIYDRGFVSHEEVNNIRNELMRENRERYKKCKIQEVDESEQFHPGLDLDSWDNYE